MLPTQPLWLYLNFGLITALAIELFSLAAHRSRWALAVVLAWLVVQSALSLNGFYTITTTLPPRLAFALGPPLVLLLSRLATARGRAFLASLRLDVLTLLHVVRLPVELGLYGLFVHGAVPRSMTFADGNWDISHGPECAAGVLAGAAPAGGPLGAAGLERAWVGAALPHCAGSGAVGALAGAAPGLRVAQCGVAALSVWLAAGRAGAPGAAGARGHGVAATIPRAANQY